MKGKKIIILGAARSGTHFLSKILKENINKYKYYGEVREVWETALDIHIESDLITKNMYSKQGIEKVKQYFLSDWKENEILIEKTANNCFRTSLVYDVFPDAYFIHIIRDGRDVAISSRKKMMGDIRKISKVENGNNITLKSRLNNLFIVVKNKFKYLSIKNFKRYLLGALSQLGLIRNTLWGPRFLGMKEASKIYTPLELSALQWKLSVESIKSFFNQKSKDTKYYEVEFEKLIQNPEHEIKLLFNFLNINLPTQINCDFIEQQVIKSNRKITNNEEKEINQIIETVLKEYGYLN